MNVFIGGIEVDSADTKALEEAEVCQFVENADEAHLVIVYEPDPEEVSAWIARGKRVVAEVDGRIEDNAYVQKLQINGAALLTSTKPRTLSRVGLSAIIRANREN